MKTKVAVSTMIVAVTACTLVWRYASRRRQLPCPTWLAWILDNPWTEIVGSKQITLERIGLQPGEIGLDVGCGPGRLALPAARRVGPGGKIVAVDIQAGMLERLQQRASAAGLTNIQTLLADVTVPDALPTDLFDRAWLVTVLGEIPNRLAALQAVYRALKPGGTLSITEILLDPHYQSHKTVASLCMQAGFTLAQAWGNPLAFTMNCTKQGN